MANFLKKLFKAYGPERLQASGRFTTAGTGACTTADLNGIVSIARTGVGVFLVTLMDAAKEYHVELSREGTAALSANQVITSAKSLTSRTVEVTVAAAGSAADTTGLTVAVTVQLRLGN